MKEIDIKAFILNNLYYLEESELAEIGMEVIRLIRERQQDYQ